MKPLVLTLAGAALGVATVLPVARAQLTLPLSAVATAPAAPAPGSNLVAGAADAAPRPSDSPVPVTVVGPVVATRYGPVQVQVSVASGRLVAASSLQLPDGDGQSRQISLYAGPRLDQRAVAGQGQVDVVSGATWTSDGYQASLQAALDSARAAGAILAAP